jgi:hypothetical protein
MADIFISYARPDKAFAEGLARDLISKGYSVWWDANLVGADDFYEVILDALRRAKAAIVIWSRTSTKSRFVRDEARFAMHLEKLIAVRAPNLDIYDIPFGFQGQHTDDINNREQIYRALAKLGIRPAGEHRAGSWDRVRQYRNVDEIDSFLASNPSKAQRDEALSILRDVRAKQRAFEPDRSTGDVSLTKSNLQAFLYGFTFRIPKFQLSEQGTWTSFGAAISYSAVAALLAITASSWMPMLGETKTNADSPPILSAIIFAMMGVFLWLRAGAFLSQRIFLAAVILLLAFAVQASLSTVVVILDAISFTSTEEDKILYFFGLLIVYLNLSLYRIRSYR